MYLGCLIDIRQDNVRIYYLRKNFSVKLFYFEFCKLIEDI